MLGAVRGHGPFAGVSANTAIIMVEGFVAVAAVTALVIAAAVVECNRVSGQLQDALARVISGYIPICARRKKIREQDDAWHLVEEYVTRKTSAEFTHSICPACARELYGSLPGHAGFTAG